MTKKDELSQHLVRGTPSRVAPIVRDRNSRLRVRVTHFDYPETAETQQQFADECDMNKIVDRANRGIAPRYQAQGVPQYGDFSNVPDLPTAYAQIQRAEEAFMRLPAQLRLELGNDPARISQLTQDQIKRFGLGKPTTPSQPTPPEASQPDPAPEKTSKAEPKKSVKTDP